jgi:hypothetical protein
MNITKLLSIFVMVILLTGVSVVSAEDRNVGVVIYPPAGGTESVCLTFDSGDTIYDALDEATGAIEDNYEREDEDSEFELSVAFGGTASEVASVTRNDITVANDVTDAENKKIWTVFTNNGNSSTFSRVNESLSLSSFSREPTTGNGYVIALQYATYNGTNLTSPVPSPVAHSNICKDMLDLEEIEVSVDGDSSGADEDGGDIDEDVMPESTITFDITLANLYDDDTEMLIEDISIEAILEDIDDGDDIEQTTDITEIEADDEESVELEFEIPLIVEIDEYDLVLTIEGEDENGLKFNYEIEYIVEVEKEKHELRVTDFNIEPAQVSCERLLSLNYEILNLGEEEEDAEITITNSELGIDKKMSKTLSEDIDDSSNQLSDSMSIMLPENITQGTYRVLLEAEYYSDTTASRYFELLVNECVEETPVEEKEDTTQNETGTDDQQKTGDDIEVITINESTTPDETKEELADEEGLPLWVIILLIVGGLILYIGTIIVVLVVASGRKPPKSPKRPSQRPPRRPSQQPVEPQQPQQESGFEDFDNSDSFY